MAFTPNYRGKTTPKKAPPAPVKQRSAQPGKKTPNYRALMKQAREILGKNVSGKTVRRLVSAIVIGAAAGNREQAAKILKQMAAEHVVKVANEHLKISNPPADGVMGSADQSIPTSVSSLVKMISGKNGLYTAKCHKIHFDCGNRAGAWMRGLKKSNGAHSATIFDTIASYDLDDPKRLGLVKQVGINQKMQYAVSSNNFGFTHAELNAEFGITGFQNSTIANQRVYGAISKLTSKAIITSLNKYVPTYVKVTLVKIDSESYTWPLAFNEAVNLTVDPPAQTNGAMPVLWQQNNAVNVLDIGNTVTVDPITPGVKGSDAYRAVVEPICSKTVKLSAGDRLELTYDHHCGPGIRLDKLHGGTNATGVSGGYPVTYSLLVESWGEEVDAYRWVADPEGTPISIIKATCPHALQFEFKKRIEGMNTDQTSTEAQDTGTTKGWFASSYAVKVYSDFPVQKGGTVQRYNQPFDKLNEPSATGYVVPVMSDAIVVKAGQTK